jgi:acyl-coenzyme A synthetase/AMP-(fatty) acid ligase
MIAMVGCMKIGAVPIPSIEMLTPRDVEYRLRNSEARGAVRRAEHTHKFSARHAALAAPNSLGRAEHWLEWDNEMADAASLLEPAVLEADDPAIMSAGEAMNPAVARRFEGR